MNDKMLASNDWRTMASKFKLKDNGLQRALALYEGLDEKKYDERLKAISSVGQLAGSLRKDRYIADVPILSKYLDGMADAAEDERNQIAKDKAVAALAAKSAAAALKKAESEKKEQDEDEEEQATYQARLKAALQKLKSSKDLSYPFIICDARPHCAIMVAKQITTKHKEELTHVTNGGKHFLPIGECKFENGKFTFTMDRPVSGLARKLQDSILNFTGKKLPIAVGTEWEDGD